MLYIFLHSTGKNFDIDSFQTEETYSIHFRNMYIYFFWV